MSDCKILSFTPQSAINAKAHRKEKSLCEAWTLFDLDKKAEVVNVRTYWPGTVCYACVWIFGTDRHANGSNKAGGWGYDKTEQAVKGAFREAGVKIDEAYNHHDPESILKALAAFWGITNYYIFHAHA